MRLVVRARGLKPEEKQKEGMPGAWMSVWAFCRDARNKVLSTNMVTSFNSDTSDWTGLRRRHRGDCPGPIDSVDFLLPEGTDNVRIDFKTTTRGQSVPARVWVDTVELSIVESSGSK